MATSYRIYGDSGTGTIDWSTPLYQGTVRAYAPGPLAYPGSYLFAVRAYDTTSGLEEQNVDSIRLLVLDSAGADITDLPAAVAALAAVATPGGALATWTYPDAAPAPLFFSVWLGVDGPPDFAAPADATVTYEPDGPVPIAPATIPGLSTGHTYTIGVRATNAVGDGPTATAAVAGNPAGPAAVEDLAGIAGW